MKLTALLILLATAAVGAMIGTVIIGRGAGTSSGPERPEKRIGEQGAGKLISGIKPTWTPQRNPDGYTVTATLPPNDPRIAQFADFPVLLPTYLPKDTHVENVIVTLDPETEKRLVQRGRIKPPE